jgi:hypothetical protein
MNHYEALSVERDGREREWDMEEILFLLNSLGDDWVSRRSARFNEHDNGYFQCTFVPREFHTIHDRSVPVPALHISYPLASC